MSSQHSILAPSKAYILSRCAGSVLMQQAHPQLTDDESEAALEGTAAHWVAEQVLLSYTTPNASVITSLDQLPDTAPNGVVIDQDMLDAVQVYVTDIMTVCNQTGGLQNLMIERTVDIKRVHDLCFGTLDCGLFVAKDGDKNNHLWVWDFKYGFGLVEAYENEQLIEYVCGLIDTLQLDDLNLTVHIKIVQPRRYHVLGSVREWVIEGHEIRAYINHLASQAALAMTLGAPTKSGDHCKHCTGRRGCDAAHEASLNAIDVSKTATPQGLTIDQMGAEIIFLERAQKAIESRLDGVKSEVEVRIENGEHCQTHSIGSGRGSTVWKPGVSEQVIAMASLLNVDVTKPPTLKTPKQVLDSTGIDETVINQYIEKRPGKAKLIEKDQTLAAKIFKQKR